MMTHRARTSLAALLLSSALLGACAAGSELPQVQPTNPAARLPTQQYGATVVDRPDEILLAPTGALSANQAAALGALVMRWNDDGRAGPILVTAAPTGLAHGTAAAAMQALASYGVPPGAVRLTSAPEVGEPSPIRVGFAALEAVVADCATKWTELTRTSSNQVHAGFGCAVNSNMAMQTANPRDLALPRADTPADGQRRADVIGRYRQGQSTASQRGADERGVVSSAVQ
jgi:pilus assembly protein CpaD